MQVGGIPKADISSTHCPSYKGKRRPRGVDAHPPIPRGKILVLLAEDLRLEDNLAFAIASDPARDGFAVLRIQPEARGRPLRTLHRREVEDAGEARICVFRLMAGGDFR